MTLRFSFVALIVLAIVTLSVTNGGAIKLSKASAESVPPLEVRIDQLEKTVTDLPKDTDSRIQAVGNRLDQFAAEARREMAEIKATALGTANALQKAKESTSTFDIVSRYTGPLCGALFGGAFAMVAAFLLQRRTERRNVTRSFIDEFFSTSFLYHRIATSELARKVRREDVPIETVAKGYWYPSLPEEEVYTGATSRELNEHQHLEVYLGFLVRLAHSYRKDTLDKDEVSSALRSGYLWHGDLVTWLADETRAQVRKHKAELPIWVDAVDTVNELLSYKLQATGT
jgi:hypothetical protein